MTCDVTAIVGRNYIVVQSLGAHTRETTCNDRLNDIIRWAACSPAARSRTPLLLTSNYCAKVRSTICFCDMNKSGIIVHAYVILKLKVSIVSECPEGLLWSSVNFAYSGTYVITRLRNNVVVLFI